MLNLEIRPLAENDPRDDFRSENQHLDTFFHKYAGQNQFKFKVGVTYVAVIESRIVGYVTVSAGSVEPALLDDKGPKYPRPVLILARMAVHHSEQGRGVGPRMLKYVYRLAAQMSENIGCVGILVDAKLESVWFYERYGFAAIGSTNTNVPKLPMFLNMARVKAALLMEVQVSTIDTKGQSSMHSSDGSTATREIEESASLGVSSAVSGDRGPV